MKRHKVTRKTKSGKTITYWRGSGAPSKGGMGEAYEKFKAKKSAKTKSSRTPVHKIPEHVVNDYILHKMAVGTSGTTSMEAAKAKLVKKYGKSASRISKNYAKYRKLRGLS